MAGEGRVGLQCVELGARAELALPVGPAGVKNSDTSQELSNQLFVNGLLTKRTQRGVSPIYSPLRPFLGRPGIGATDIALRLGALRPPNPAGAHRAPMLHV